MGGFLPILADVETTREMIQEFRGYNHNLRIPENEFDGMQNMSSSFYPVLASRGRRGILTTLTKSNGLCAKNNLFWVNGTQLFYNGVGVSGLVLSDTPKQFVSMGAYLLIWPDKIYFNTTDSTFGSLEATISITGSITCTLTKSATEEYDDLPATSDTAPSDPSDGDEWIDSSVTPHVLKQYSETSGTWIPIATTYVKITASDIGSQFKEYDAVTIAGLSNERLNGSFIVYAKGDDYIAIQALIDTTVTQTGGVTVSRTCPDMDFLTESENRAWGCSSEKHEIYACKLGDPFNWNVYMSLSTDSYSVTVGTDGDFTAACTHAGSVLFFKEDYIHKVTGNAPSNFRISNVRCRGVEKGSEKSLAIVNERLYYKARTAICMYDGSFPVEVSSALGDVRYTDATAGSLGNKYFVSMKDVYGAYHMFVFDEAKTLWHREDSMHAAEFATHEGELFFVDANTNRIMTVNGRLSVHEGGFLYDVENGRMEDSVEWFVESGEIGLGLADSKFISKLLVRMKVVSDIRIELKYDSEDEWTTHMMTTSAIMKTYALPIIPRRCDHFRIRISGDGECRVYSITKTIEGGGET